METIITQLLQHYISECEINNTKPTELIKLFRVNGTWYYIKINIIEKS